MEKTPKAIGIDLTWFKDELSVSYGREIEQGKCEKDYVPLHIKQPSLVGRKLSPSD